MGTVMVVGPSAEWATNQLTSGDGGSGNLTILAGGSVQALETILGSRTTGMGTVTISGMGSQLGIESGLAVGYQGSGVLNIGAGGQVSSGNGYIGHSASGTGTVAVTGAGAYWSSGSELHVGREGGGTLTVTDQGLVTTGTLWASLIDLHGDGTITATKGAVIDADLQFNASTGTQAVTTFGSGGTLTVTANGGHLGAGYKGTGTLTVKDGIAVTSTLGTLGYYAGSEGSAVISGTASQWTSINNLFIGRYGKGTIGITSGGQVTNRHGYLADANGSSGDATVEGVGSAWFNDETLHVGRYGQGTLNIVNGGLVSVGTVLTIDYNGGHDSFINLSSGGQLALYGEVEDSLTQFLGLVQGSDAIRYWSTDLADWAPITDATYGIDYTLEYLTSGDLAGHTVLTVGTVPSPVAGDFNGDGIVNLADYTVWRDNLGAADDSAIAHVGDGMPGVDGGDYEVWKTQFGEQQDSSSIRGITAVPEPTALVMVAGVLVVALRYVDRRPRRA
jgi:T5SS/PEP-CTERM-associated repeat protein